MKTHGPTGGRGRYTAPPLAEINIIPLVDVTLVILIIFMVTMTFDKKESPEGDPVFNLPITLPYSDAATEASTPGPLLVLGIDKNGKKYVAEAPATTEAVIQKVRETAKNPAARVRIDADRDARYIDVIELIELCQFEGLRNVGLRTSNKDQPQQ